MARSQSLQVNIIGENKSLKRALGDSEKRMSRFGGAAGKIGKGLKVAGAGAAIGVGAVVVVLGKAAKAAMEAEKSATRMNTQLSALGKNTPAVKKNIDATVTSMAAMSGFDDEDLQDAFTRIVRSTGNVKTALGPQGLALAMDIARAKGIDAAKAAEIVAKAQDGQTGALKKLGVEVTKGMTGQQALAAAQKTFAGQAEAYGKTAAGAQERFGVAIEGVQEKIGAKLLPILTQLMNWVSANMPAIEGAISKVASAFDDAFNIAKTIFDFLKANHQIIIALAAGLGTVTVAWGAYTLATKGWAAATRIATAVQLAFNGSMLANPIGIVVIAVAALVAALVLLYQKNETVRKVIDAAWASIREHTLAAIGAIKSAIGSLVVFFQTNMLPPIIAVFNAIKAFWDKWGANIVAFFKRTFELFVSNIRAVIQIIRGIFTGDWQAVWNGVKTIVSNAVEQVKNILRNLGPIVLSLMKTVGSKLWEGFKSGAAGLAGKLGDLMSDGLAAIPKYAKEAFNKAKTIGGEILDGIGSIISQMPSKVGEIATAVIKAIPGAFSSVGSKIIEVLKDALSSVNLPTPYFKMREFDPPGPGSIDVPYSIGWKARGGKVKTPMVMVGEEAPQHPEWVIATNPAYRKKNLGYLAQAAGALGVGRAQGGLVYPLARKATGIIGTPGGGTHNASDWQSRNALDFAAPMGTDILAVANGIISGVGGSMGVRRSGGKVIYGQKFTLNTDKGGVFYTHMGNVKVHSGQRVTAGQHLADIWAPSGMPPHLHLGVQNGSPYLYNNAALYDNAPLVETGGAVRGPVVARPDGKGPMLLTGGIAKTPYGKGENARRIKWWNKHHPYKKVDKNGKPIPSKKNAPPGQAPEGTESEVEPTIETPWASDWDNWLKDATFGSAQALMTPDKTDDANWAAITKQGYKDRITTLEGALASTSDPHMQRVIKDELTGLYSTYSGMDSAGSTPESAPVYDPTNDLQAQVTQKEGLLASARRAAGLSNESNRVFTGAGDLQLLVVNTPSGQAMLANNATAGMGAQTGTASNRSRF